MSLLQIFFKRHPVSDCCLRIRFLIFAIEKEINFNVITSLRILGIKIYQSTITQNCITCNLFGVFKWIKKYDFQLQDLSNLKAIINLCMPRITQKSNREVVIYSLSGSPSGESFLVLNNISHLHGSDEFDVYICVDKKWKCVLSSMFAPDCKVIFIDRTIFTHVVFSAAFYINRRKYRIYQFFPTTHYIEQDKLIKANGVHYSDYIANKLGLPKLCLAPPLLSNKDFAIAKSVAKSNEINLNHFVIVCPEANSCKQSSGLFWSSICNFLESNGFDVYINSTKDISNNFCSEILSHSELYALATQAKLIIGLRSGLLEILAMTGVPIIAIYTSFPKRGALDEMQSSDVMTGFTLKKISGIKSNVTEFDFNKISEKDVLNAIKNILRI